MNGRTNRPSEQTSDVQLFLRPGKVAATVHMVSLGLVSGGPRRWVREWHFAEMLGEARIPQRISTPLRLFTVMSSGQGLT